MNLVVVSVLGSSEFSWPAFVFDESDGFRVLLDSRRTISLFWFLVFTLES